MLCVGTILIGFMGRWQSLLRGRCGGMDVTLPLVFSSFFFFSLEIFVAILIEFFGEYFFECALLINELVSTLHIEI